MALEAAPKLHSVNLFCLQSSAGWGISAELQKSTPINPSSASQSRAEFFFFLKMHSKTFQRIVFLLEKNVNWLPIY